MEQLIKISQDPIPFEQRSLLQHSCPFTSKFVFVNVTTSTASFYPHRAVIVAEDTSPSCRGRNKEQLPRERRPQLFPLLQGQFKSTLPGFLVTENKRASRSSCHSTASFLNVKTSPDRKTHLGSSSYSGPPQRKIILSHARKELQRAARLQHIYMR